MCFVEKINVAYVMPTRPASWRSCAPLSSLWCVAQAMIHSKSPKRSSLIIPTKPSGYSVADRVPEWSVKFWPYHEIRILVLDNILIPEPGSEPPMFHLGANVQRYCVYLRLKAL